jgi:hypothetical protein
MSDLALMIFLGLWCVAFSIDIVGGILGLFIVIFIFIAHK